jgi:hypothetical protein
MRWVTIMDESWHRFQQEPPTEMRVLIADTEETLKAREFSPVPYRYRSSARPLHAIRGIGNVASMHVSRYGKRYRLTRRA